MATRRPKPELVDTEALPVSQFEFDDSLYNAESLNPALESLYAELGIGDGGADASVFVSKLDSDGKGTEAQVWRGDPDNYDLEQIAKKFGSGQYRVKIYVRIQTGQKVCKGNKVFAWLLSPEEEAKRNSPSIPASGFANSAGDIQRMVAEAVRAILPAVTPVQQPAPDPMAMLKDLAVVMTTLQGSQQHTQQTVTNPIGMMKDMLEVMASVRGDMEPIERGSNASGMDLMVSMVNKFGPMFEKVLAGGLPALNGGMAQPGLPHYPQPAPMQSPPTMAQPAIAPQPAPPQGDDVSLKLRMGLQFLVGQCKGGGAPETYAEVVIDSVPTETLKQLIAAPDPLGYLSTFEPSINEHKDWFNALLAEMKSIITESDASGEGAAS